MDHSSGTEPTVQGKTAVGECVYVCVRERGGHYHNIYKSSSIHCTYFIPACMHILIKCIHLLWLLVYYTPKCSKCPHFPHHFLPYIQSIRTHDLGSRGPRPPGGEKTWSCGVVWIKQSRCTRPATCLPLWLLAP